MRGVLAVGLVGVTSCISIAELAAPDAGDAGDALDASDGGCPGTYPQAVMALPGLVAYWRLDETSGTTAADRTARHPGTYGGSVTLGVPGLLAGDPDLAASFDGDAGALVTVPGAADLDLQTFTLGAIIRPSAIVASAMGQQIVARENAYWLQLDAPSNGADKPHLEVGLIAPGPVDYPESHPSAALGTGVTSHVVGTYDGHVVSAYIDGALVASDVVSADIQKPGTDLYIGSWNGTTNLQTGVIDEVFVSSVALDAGQVRRLWLAAQGCAYDAGE